MGRAIWAGLGCTHTAHFCSNTDCPPCYYKPPESWAIFFFFKLDKQFHCPSLLFIHSCVQKSCGKDRYWQTCWSLLKGIFTRGKLPAHILGLTEYSSLPLRGPKMMPHHMHLQQRRLFSGIGSDSSSQISAISTGTPAPLCEQITRKRTDFTQMWKHWFYPQSWYNHSLSSLPIEALSAYIIK